MALTVAVIDGMGGGIGKEVVGMLRKEFKNSITIIALGINAVATDKMMQEKADRGASGENAIRYSINKADFIIGPIGIIFPNGLMGEVTKEIADLITSSGGKKILIPVSHPDITICGLSGGSLSFYINNAVEELKKMSKSLS